MSWVWGWTQGFPTDCPLILLSSKQTLNWSFKGSEVHDELFQFAGDVETFSTTQIANDRGVVWTPNFSLAFTYAAM